MVKARVLSPAYPQQSFAPSQVARRNNCSRSFRPGYLAPYFRVIYLHA